MNTIEMEVIDDPDLTEYALLEPTWDKRGQPVAEGEDEYRGDTKFVCGICGEVLARHLIPNLKTNALLKCPGCGAINGFPEQWR